MPWFRAWLERLARSGRNPLADPNEQEVDTLANVAGGGGSVPVVDAKWELPDMQQITGFQYWAGSGPTDLNANDDSGRRR